MPSKQKQISFTKLWEKIPPPSAKVWKHSPGQEVLQLLCSALWHLELAAEIEGGFSMAAMEEFSIGGYPPWHEWLKQKPILSVGSTEKQLVMNYSFPTHFGHSLKNLLQTLLLADAALRLAGAWDILVKRNLVRTSPIVLEDYTSILQTNGELNIPSSYSAYKSGIFKNVLIVIAFRDSFMHGETLTGNLPKSTRIRARFREKWITGVLNQNGPKYSPFEIARACRGVWEKLVSCLKHLKGL